MRVLKHGDPSPVWGVLVLGTMYLTEHSRDVIPPCERAQAEKEGILSLPEYEIKVASGDG